MKAIRKPIEEEFMVLKPNINSIKECYLFLTNQEEKHINEEILNIVINDCLKNVGLRHVDNLIPFNSIIVKSDITITSFPIQYFKQMYIIKESDEIVEARSLMSSCNSDIGFCGSPDYNKAEKLVNNYELKIKELLKE